MAAEERRTGAGISQKLIVIEPVNTDYSIGLNLVETQVQQNYIQLTNAARSAQ